MAAQTAPQASTGDGRIDEFTRDSEQVVRGQQKRLAQLDNDEFLRRCQRRVHRDRSMGAIDSTGAILPFTDRLPRGRCKAVPEQPGTVTRLGSPHESGGWCVLDYAALGS